MAGGGIINNRQLGARDGARQKADDALGGAMLNSRKIDPPISTMPPMTYPGQTPGINPGIEPVPVPKPIDVKPYGDPLSKPVVQPTERDPYSEIKPPQDIIRQPPIRMPGPINPPALGVLPSPDEDILRRGKRLGGANYSSYGNPFKEY